ncbi:MAG: alpha/beta fold hydrolase [Gemmatimonadetes bacterium]|nr:alpha/beta fold hydrolase [Gemmatimonadota bacterium]MBI3504582.1 alpha/beta fold hydrolase [Pseudomonadota bacterium]
MTEIPSKFHPAWWLPGPHLPTIWGKLGRHRPMVHDRLERISTTDGDHVTLVRMGVVRPGVPHLLVLHGLEGKVSAKYAHGLLEQARVRGWSGDLMMFRSCDGEVNSARRFYHSGETSDVDLVVRTLIEREPDIHLVVCGVSLGGNVTLKWLGELGPRTPRQIKRAAGVSVPYDLEAGSIHMERGFARRYVRHFLGTLTEKTLKKMERYPDLVDRPKLLAARTFRDFDNLLTGPLHGFADAHDYYSRSSSIRFIESIQVPTLLMSAEDDPFLPSHVLDRVRAISAGNHHLTIEFSRRGGHVGWVEGHPWRQRYYMEERVVEWLSTGA